MEETQGVGVGQILVPDFAMVGVGQDLLENTNDTNMSRYIL